jgi:hypothetical protein
MGCTEPIALAYAAAMARRTLGEMPVKGHFCCSDSEYRGGEARLRAGGYWGGNTGTDHSDEKIYGRNGGQDRTH